MVSIIQPDEIESGGALAAALGWRGDQLSARSIVVGERTLDLEASRIEGEGAVVFGRIEDHATADDLNAVSLYGYHASCPWGVVADRAGLHLVSSRWLKNAEWYRLPQIQWDDVPDLTDLLAAFAPSGVRHSEPYKRMLRIEEPTSFLRGVDDALVERLDSWRERAVRYSRSSVTKIDEQLQTLYAQLFVLRTVEDRGIDDTIPPTLSATTSGEEFNFDQWNFIYDRAKSRIGSDLFSQNIADSIDPHILNGVIRDLYFPKRVPGHDVRYDFSWISADVLGLAYEKYLSTVLQPAPIPAQAELFLQPQRGVERLSVRKSAGAYYTPRFLTNYLATTCIDQFFLDDQSPPPKIIDFSCGSGSFLVAAVNRVLTHLKRRDPKRAWARELIEGGNIAGIDVDAKAVTAARLHLWQRLIEEPGALPLPNLSEIVRVGDGLDTATWGHLDTKYDIVLGNPPFLTTKLVTDRSRLENSFVTAKGRYDFSSLFVEQAIRALHEGGVLGLVIPNRLFLNKSAESLRDLLTQTAHIRVVVDFGTTKVFDADAYVGCIVAEKGSHDVNDRRKLRVIQVRSLEPDFMTAELLDAQSRDVGSASTAVRSYSARQPGSAAWSLLSVDEQRNRILLDEASVRLDTIATVAQGIRTGANAIFILEVEEDDDTALARVRNGLEEQWFVERDLLEPVVFGSELQRFSEAAPSKKLLYPYKLNLAISEAELKERYPRTHEYLWAYRDILSSRASLVGTSGKYYELIRPRDERWLRRPKLLIRDLAPSTAFAVDERGHSFLVGGTAVVPADPDMCLPLAAYLNSNVVSRIVSQQTPSFRGDFQKFEPGVLSAVPILTAIIDDADVAAKLRDLARLRMNYSEGSSEALATESDIDNFVLEVADSLGASLVT